MFPARLVALLPRTAAALGGVFHRAYFFRSPATRWHSFDYL